MSYRLHMAEAEGVDAALLLAGGAIRSRCVCIRGRSPAVRRSQLAR